MGRFVGIDLGTTFSVVAYINKDGKPETIQNEYGNVINPSVIYLGPGGPLVGEEAKEKQSAGEEAIASFFKRSMGDPHFELEFFGKSYSPVDLSALVLKKLKDIAERKLGGQVMHAVITVPAYFNNMQREATIKAGQLAGLQVLSIISEPTAAALAFGMRPMQEEKKVLVYDLGGGTFDISIVQISAAEQRVIGTGGDHNLGGKDWDDRIVNYLAAKFDEEFGMELVGDDFNTLLIKAENAKKSLTSRTSVDVRVQAGMNNGIYDLTREQFENITRDLMERTQKLTDQTLEEVGLTWSQIDQVLLVGGSTRMPMVRNYVERMSGKPPLSTVNPDEAVALGAAIQAAMDMESLNPSQPRLALAGRKKSIDVMSHSLGMIAINEDGSKYTNSIIIQKNKPIPSTETSPYSLRISQRRENKLEVYMTQGESISPVDCAYLGKYVFSDLPALSAKTAILDISYAYDKNGVVNVSAVERSTQVKLTVNVEPLPEDIPYRFTLPPAQEIDRQYLTIYLAFDLSGSMSGEPLMEAQKAAHAFVGQCDLCNASIGLISFSDTIHVETTASQNAKEINRAIDGLCIGRTGYGNSTHPFDTLHGLMSGISGARFGIVLADGVWSNQQRAIVQAKNCHEEGIEIIGIGFGGVDKDFIRQISSSDENSIFTSMGGLTEAFSNIAQEITEGGRTAGSKSGLRVQK
jgi:molecular chaperone DnaK